MFRFIDERDYQDVLHKEEVLVDLKALLRYDDIKSIVIVKENNRVLVYNKE